MGAQLIAGQPLWAKIFYLVRTGNPQDALAEALRYQQAIEHREAGFISHFRAWIDSPDRKYVFRRRPLSSVPHAHLSGSRSRIETRCMRRTTHTCSTPPPRTRSNSRCTSSWARSTPRGGASRTSPSRRRTGCGSSSAWSVHFVSCAPVSRALTRLIARRSTRKSTAACVGSRRCS